MTNSRKFSRGGVDFYFVNARGLRSFMTPVDESLESFGVPFGHDLYPAVRKVAHPTPNIELQGLQMREFSENTPCTLP